MKKAFLETWGPSIFVGGWAVLAFESLWCFFYSAPKMTPAQGIAGVGVIASGGMLMGMALRTFRRKVTSLQAKVNIWSSGRPGEVLVGVLHTGISAVDPAGLILNLDCVEINSGGQWLLWTSEVRSPQPSGPDSWPFHFSIPVEGPPSGLSTDGEVVWQLRAKSVSLPIFEAVVPVSVARIAGPPSHLLPVPPPSFRKSSGALRRSVAITEHLGQIRLCLHSRFSFPGPNPIVVWTVIHVGLFMVLAKMAPAWTLWALAGGNGGVILFFALLWFGCEELVVTGQEIIFQRRLWKFGKVRRFLKSEVTGVRVAFSGPPPHFGVRIERGDKPPLAVFDGFTDSLEAHEAARSVLRALGPVSQGGKTC
jgi:hypothetical protein